MDKRLLILGICTLLLLVVFSTGCVSSDEKKSKSINITFNEVIKDEYNESEGFRVVGINVTVDNPHTETIWVYSSDFSLVLKDGSKHKSISAGGAKLEPGNSTRSRKIALWFDVYYNESDLDYIKYDSDSYETKVDIP